MSIARLPPQNFLKVWNKSNTFTKDCLKFTTGSACIPQVLHFPGCNPSKILVHHQSTENCATIQNTYEN